MKIAFVINRAEFSIPLGISYLAAKLKAHDVKAFEMGEDLTRFKPDFVGYTVMSGKENGYLEYNLALKEKMDFVSIFGGPHPTYFPEIINEKGVDVVCRGEGEEVIEDIINGQRGVVMGKLTAMNRLPFPDRRPFYKFDIMRNHQRRTVMANRGCPFQCPYCFNNAFNGLFGYQYRTRSPQNICQEIEEERSRSDFQLVAFMDDVFTLNKEWVLNFCKEYKGLPYSIHTRYNLLDEEIVASLKRSGCCLTTVGIEAGNEPIRNRILKRNMSLK